MSLDDRRDIHFFGEIHVLNLAIRHDRKRDMTDQFRSIGVADEDVNWFYAVEPKEAAGFPSTGYCGNYMSHLSVLEIGKRKNLERLLIIEDDLNFSRNFMDDIVKVTESLVNVEWDMFYGGAIVRSTEPYNDCLRRVSPEVPVMLDHFVAFNGSAIVKAYDYLSAILTRPPGDTRGGPMPVDGAYSRYRRDYGLKTFIAEPELGCQRSTRSDLSPSWFDKTILGSIAETIRRLRR